MIKGLISNKNMDVKSQITRGFMILVLLPIIMAIIIGTMMYSIKNGTMKFTEYNSEQTKTKEAIIGHYSWVTNLNEAILTGKEFTGGKDPQNCILGKWISSLSEEDLQDEVIAKSIENLKEPHNHIHNNVDNVLQLSKTDHDEAYRVFNTEIESRVNTVISNITDITNRYEEKAKEVEQHNEALIQKAMLGIILITILCIVLAIIISRILSNRISKPIVEIEKLASHIGKGGSFYNINTLENLEEEQDNEIKKMYDSFSEMAISMEEYIDIIEIISKGDLTSDVKIRSSEDTLGKSLYSLIDNNNDLFKNIKHITDDVQVSANEINQSSIALSESSTEQAASMQGISTEVEIVSDLTKENINSVNNAIQTFDTIKRSVNDSKNKMENLVSVVEDIREASDKIFEITKAIDAIAFQTNILALNASIEAARAGTYGKGFAVVADEVRNLASKSAESAKNTKELIEGAINKTHYGVEVAEETYSTFAKIIDEIDKTGNAVTDISKASKRQYNSMIEVENRVRELASVQAENAAFSEETSAISEQMKEYSQVLTDEMNRFILKNNIRQN
ncbi:methyl-accepting chemotaxis protein [Romboutsia sp.]|uniref:methyl-accepting chemotaxis protein n=1 Tax=Romboutsia sp. TaxID=1965302 RepID=UPI003F3F90FA